MNLITKKHLNLMKGRRKLDPIEGWVFTIDGIKLYESMWHTYVSDDETMGKAIDTETYDTYFSYTHYPLPWPLKKRT